MAKRPDLRTIDIDTAAGIFSASPSAVRRMIAAGTLRSETVAEGRRRRVRVLWPDVLVALEARVFPSAAAKSKAA